MSEQTTTVRDVLKKLAADNAKLEKNGRKLERRLDTAERTVADLYDDNRALRRHNSQLASAVFLLIAWQNDQLSEIYKQQEGQPEGEAAGLYIQRFADLQSQLAPETFRRFYGIDPETGNEIGPGVLTDGTFNFDALQANLDDVPAGEMGRIHFDNGALDN